MVEAASKHGKEISRREKERTEFIAIVSHQLRTPLAIVRGFLEALVSGDQGPVNPGQKEYLSEAHAITNEMIALVNDYIDIAKMDPTKLRVKRAATDLVKLVEEIVKEVTPLAKASNVEIDFTPAAGLSKLQLDEVKIRQVILNLLSNAMKYTRHAGTVTIRLMREGNHVVFSCRDTGVGIPKQQQREVFTRFFRAKNVAKLDTKGSGLGLYVAKSIVEAHGGKIWFESEEGKGTTVFFSLPI